jgi:hypothetical protein
MHSSEALGEYDESKEDIKVGMTYAEKSLQKILRKHKRDLKVYEDMLEELEK